MTADFFIGWVAGFASLAGGTIIALAIVHLKPTQEEAE